MLKLQKYSIDVLFHIDRQPNNLQFMSETKALHPVKSWRENCGREQNIVIWSMRSSLNFSEPPWPEARYLWSALITFRALLSGSAVGLVVLVLNMGSEELFVGSERLVVLGSYQPQRGGERTDGLDVKRWEEEGRGELGSSPSVASAGSQPHCYVGPQPLRPLPNHCLCQKV